MDFEKLYRIETVLKNKYPSYSINKIILVNSGKPEKIEFKDGTTKIVFVKVNSTTNTVYWSEN
jgi:hypothetical protein